MTAKRKYKVHALGCRTNQYEAEAFRNQLEQLGYEQANDDESAEVLVVNTCTVTEGADSSSRSVIRKFARDNPGSQLVVTGCLAERDPSLVKLEGVTHVVSNKDKENLLKVVFPEEELPEFSIKRFDAHTRAFIKVQDGCNSFCSYCIIPFTRGRSRSRSIDDIVKEVEVLVSSGYQEIVLTGINIGDFDGDEKAENKKNLADLIRVVDKIPGVRRVRVSSIDPDEVDDNLQDAILNSKNTCHSMHVVLQSGSNVVLKRMRRKYTRQQFNETIRRLKEASNNFTFTTDVIYGFPGETDYDFQETLDVLREVEFAKVHSFPYSDRPGTRAERFQDKIPPNVISERRAKILRATEEIAFSLREKYVGRRMTILTEEADEEFLFGHTDNFLGVLIPKENYKPNTLLEVDLLKNSPKGLLGKVVQTK